MAKRAVILVELLSLLEHARVDSLPGTGNRGNDKCKTQNTTTIFNIRLPLPIRGGDGDQDQTSASEGSRSRASSALIVVSVFTSPSLRKGK